MALTRREQTSEEGVIQSSNFGGLNTTASPVNMPYGDASALLNVDTDISGRLQKRKGTRVIQGPYEITTTNVHPFGVLTNNGVPLVINTYGLGLIVSSVVDDVSNPVAFFSNVFRNTRFTPKYVTLPGDNLRVLILTAEHPPIQVSFVEYNATPNTTGNSLTIARGSPYVGTGQFAASGKIFVDGVLVAGTITEITTTMEVNIPSGYVPGQLVSILYCKWSWWAEAEHWWGDRFYQEVPRAGATPQDAVVQVPQHIISDMSEGEVVPYGIWAYGSRPSTADWVNGRDTYIAPGAAPVTENEYVFSEGVPSAGSALNPTPYFITYGRQSDEYERDISDTDIDTTNGIIYMVDHNFEAGDQVSINYPGAAQIKFVFTANADSITLSNTYPSYTPPGLTQAFAANLITAINVATNELTLSSTVGITSRVRVSYSSNGAAPSGGLNASTGYYVNVVSAGVITLWFDPGLQLPVDITSNGGGTQTIRRDAGLKVTALTRYRTIFVRARKNKFCAGLGQGPENMSVTIDNNVIAHVASNTDVNTWYAFTSNTTRQAATATRCKYYSVPARAQDSRLGVSPLARIRVRNTETRWLGTSAIAGIDAVTTGSGGCIPVYGLGYYADYLNGQFPSCGVVFQERLVLSGFRNAPNAVIFSATADLLVKNEFYNFFQITDDLELTTADPFDVLLSDDDNGRVVALAEWQNFLFAFTNNAVYRISGANGIITPEARSVALVSSKGAMNANAVYSTEDNIYFLSDTGVFALPLTVSGDYRAQEISTKIKDVFLAQVRHYNKSWLVYNPADFKLYVGVQTVADSNHSDKLYVFDIRQQSWTEYYSHLGFRVYGAATYTDKISGTNFAFGYQTSCHCGVARFNFKYPLDYSEYQPPSDTLALLRMPQRVITPLSSRVRRHKLDITMSPFLDEYDVTVWISGVALVPGVDFVKVSEDTIELVNAPVDGTTLRYHASPAGSFYGVGMVRNGRGQRLNNTTFLGTFDSDPGSAIACVQYSLNYQESVVGVDDEFPLDIGDTYVLTGDGASDAWLGWVFPAYYRTYAITNEMLYKFKRMENVSLWMTQKGPYINDVSQVSIAVLYNDGSRGMYQTHLFDTGYVDTTADYVLFREPLQCLGYAHQVLVWSHDLYTWVLDGWQIQVTLMEGTGHVSGDK